MYNLLVSANPDAWGGNLWTIDEGRCVRKYTDETITAAHGALDARAVSELTGLPSIFVYENGIRADPRFGVVTDVTRRQGMVRIDYEIRPARSFLSFQDLDQLNFELTSAGGR